MRGKSTIEVCVLRNFKQRRNLKLEEMEMTKNSLHTNTHLLQLESK